MWETGRVGMSNFVLIILGVIAVTWYATTNDAQTLDQVISFASEDKKLIAFTLLIAVQPVLFFVFMILRKRQRDGKI